MLLPINLHMKKIIFFLLLFSNIQLGAQDVPGFIKDSMDIYVERALTDWKIPGVSVCIVKDGKVVVMKGYGVKEIGSTDKVDDNTLFMIGSNTKAFTATALAMFALTSAPLEVAPLSSSPVGSVYCSGLLRT